MKNKPRLAEEARSSNGGEIAEAVAVLRAPLPDDERELTREIDERAERVAAILSRRPALLCG